jgi:hypothetical protein
MATPKEKHFEKAKSIIAAAEFSISDMNHESETGFTLAEQEQLHTRIAQALADAESQAWIDAEKFYGFRD